MNYNFMNNPMFPGQQMSQGYQQNAPFMAQNIPPAPVISGTTGIVKEEPATNSMSSSYGFTIIPDEQPSKNALVVSVPAMPAEQQEQKNKKRRTTKKPDDIVRPDGNSVTVESQPTIDSYNQTSAMLEEAIREIDVIAVDLKTEMDAIKLNRNARNRTVAIGNLGETLGRLLETKISAIREINNSISKSNDMDYKKAKDLRAAQAAMDSDDKNIMALYNALIHQNAPAVPAGMTALPPQIAQLYANPDITRSPLVRADSSIDSGINPVDQGYANYLANVTPEQNAMFYENDPNVQTVVVFDHANGRKFFQVMNVMTGQPIDNVPVPDARFMDDTYLDLKTMTAKNSNLNITYPIVEINKGITSEY